MKYCQFCGTVIDYEGNFCVKCGKAIPDMTAIAAQNNMAADLPEPEPTERTSIFGEQAEPSGLPEPQKQDNKKNPKSFLPAIIIPVCAVLLIGGILATVLTILSSSRKNAAIVDVGQFAAPDESALINVAEDMDLVSNELILSAKNGTTEKEIKAIIAEYEGEIVGRNTILNEYQIRFPGKGEKYIQEILNGIKDFPELEDVFFVTSIRSAGEVFSNDSEYDSWNINFPSGNNWGLEAVNVPGAWDYNNKLKTVRIGIIDSSLQYDHPDLRINRERVRVLPTSDFKSMEEIEAYYDRYVDEHFCPNGRKRDCIFCAMKDHGTHCSGIAGALANNKKGVAGVCWNAEIYFTTYWYLYKDGEGQMDNRSSTAGLISNITWLVANGCRVISISVGSVSRSEPNTWEENDARYFNSAIKKLEDAGYDFLICKSAGNEDDDASYYRLNRVMTTGECAKDHVVMVAALQNSSYVVKNKDLPSGERMYRLANYSNFGESVDVAAPGSAILSTVYGNNYELMSGTSMATPFVAGVAGMIYGADENFDCRTVKSVLCETGKKYTEKNRIIHHIIDADAALEYALANKGAPERSEPNLGFIIGTVRDAKTADLVEKGAIYITDETSGNIYITEFSEGLYEICLSPGTYTMQIYANDYKSETIYHVIVDGGVVTYNILLNLVQESNVHGYIYGFVVDAFDGNFIPYADITVYEGINCKEGNPVYISMCDSDGGYCFHAAPGNYTVVASADGYTTGYTTVLCIAAESKYEQNCTITPILKPGEIRAVLTWGTYPEDLDSHLLGPTPTGDRFHIFYKEKNYYYGNELYDNLDVDDTTSYGPETTSVYIGLDGIYKYCVHNYTDRSSTTSSSMSVSGAQVKLYFAGQDEPLVFNVPNQPGTVWTVFTMENGRITPINEMSFEEEPYHVGY